MMLVFVLGSASAIGKARQGQWWTAGAILLPVLGMVGMLLGGVAWQSTSLFWLGCLFVAAGFGAETRAYWTTRTPGTDKAVHGQGSSVTGRDAEAGRVPRALTAQLRSDMSSTKR